MKLPKVHVRAHTRHWNLTPRAKEQFDRIAGGMDKTDASAAFFRLVPDDALIDFEDDTFVYRAEDKPGLVSDPMYPDETVDPEVSEANGYTLGLSMPPGVGPRSGIVFRGISHGEWQDIQRTGRIKSSGEYNFSFEADRTLFAADPDRARFYASGFAPDQYKPTWTRPGYVVAVRQDPTLDWKIDSDGENVFTVKPVPIKDIVAVWEVRVATEKPGKIDPSGGGRHRSQSYGVKLVGGSWL